MPMHINVGRLCVYEMRTFFKTSGNSLNLIRRLKCVTFLNSREHPKVCKDNKYVRVNFGEMSNAVHKYLDNDTFPVFLALTPIKHIGFETTFSFQVF